MDDLNHNRIVMQHQPHIGKQEALGHLLGTAISVSEGSAALRDGNGDVRKLRRCMERRLSRMQDASGSGKPTRIG